MTNNFDKILDECIDRINLGESVNACLSDYPDYIEQLEPLLQAMLQTREAYSFAPSASAERAARQHFNAALDRASTDVMNLPALLMQPEGHPLDG